MMNVSQYGQQGGFGGMGGYGGGYGGQQYQQQGLPMYMQQQQPQYNPYQQQQFQPQMQSPFGFPQGRGGFGGFGGYGGGFGRSFGGFQPMQSPFSYGGRQQMDEGIGDGGYMSRMQGNQFGDGGNDGPPQSATMGMPRANEDQGLRILGGPPPSNPYVPNPQDMRSAFRQLGASPSSLTVGNAPSNGIGSLLNKQ
jgi:hypothetical protein